MDSPRTEATNSEVNYKTQFSLKERLFLRLIKDLRRGRLRIEFPSGSVGLIGDPSLPSVTLTIHKSAFFRRVISGGSVGFGEAFVEGLWTTSNLSELLRVLANNQREVGRLGKGFSYLARIFNRFHHLANKNTVKQSRENIHAHYDLSNDFYATFLDPTMTYSSACFDSLEDSLEEGQLNKIDRMLDLAGVKSGDSILEIGSGWGALAIRAAQRGCRVKTITLSEEQIAYAQNRFEETGVDDQVEIALQDYRTLEGQYDAVLSCEMIEAVGKEYLSSYFETIRASLKPGARAVIQAITISDDRYENYCRSCDWIQKHIFPGGHLPSPGEIRRLVGVAKDMQLIQIDSFGSDYAETLRRWSKAFNREEAKVDAMGFDAAFRRKWNYYLSYCEAGFDAKLIDVQHVVLQRS